MYNFVAMINININDKWDYLASQNSLKLQLQLSYLLS